MKNDIALKQRRKELRKNQTLEESILWDYLKSRRFHNIKFYRQYSINSYIVDFYSSKLKLVIELDGNQHFSQDSIAYDKIREDYMDSLGIKTIRFKNQEIRNNISNVLKILSKNL